MTNHVHLIAQSSKGDLSGTLRVFKKFTSSTIIDTIEQNKKESRRNWMLWIFKKAGERNSRNKDYPRLRSGRNSGSKKIILYN
jgi:REP element-mobilizing transposase RayT